MFSFLRIISSSIFFLSVLNCNAPIPPCPIKITDISLKTLPGDFSENINPFQSFKLKKDDTSKLIEVSFTILPVSLTNNALNLLVAIVRKLTLRSNDLIVLSLVD